MSTPTTLPESAPAESAPTGTPAPLPVRASSRVVAILAIACGALLVIGTILGSAIPAALGAASRTETLTADAGGATALTLEAAAGSVRVEFGDVREATLRVSGLRGADGWTLAREGGTLHVRTDDRGPRFGDWPEFGSWFGRGREAVLTLPAALEGIDADLSLSAGTLRAAGTFGDLALDVSAGSASVDGAADLLTVGVSAGSADVDLAGVRSADLTVEAGGLDVRLTGAAPDVVSVTAAAGSVDVRLPDVPYDVTSSVSAGGLDDRLEADRSSPRAVSVDISGGYVRLSPGR
jgi:hypothetical protein